MLGGFYFYFVKDVKVSSVVLKVENMFVCMKSVSEVALPSCPGLRQL